MKQRRDCAHAATPDLEEDMDGNNGRVLLTLSASRSTDEPRLDSSPSSPLGIVPCDDVSEKLSVIPSGFFFDSLSLDFLRRSAID